MTRIVLLGASALALAGAAATVAGGAPSPPRVAGPRATTDTTPTYRLTARGAERFQCAVDAGGFRSCRSSWTPRLTVGSHSLRIRALDARGRRSRVTTVHVTVAAPGPRAREAVRADSRPWGVALVGDSLWAVNFDTGVAQRLDPATGKERARVTVGSTGSSVAGTPDGQVWAASFGDARVVRIDGDQATTRIAVGPGPEGLTSGFGALWTANKGCQDPADPCPGNGSVTRVDASTGATKESPVGPARRASGSRASSATRSPASIGDRERRPGRRCAEGPGRRRRGVRLRPGGGLRRR